MQSEKDKAIEQEVEEQLGINIAPDATPFMIVNVGYSTQRKFGKAKVQMSQTWQIDPTEISPQDARAAVLEQLRQECEAGVQNALNAADEVDEQKPEPTVPESEEDVDVEDLSEETDEGEEDWMNPPEMEEALTPDAIDEAAAMLAKED